MLTLMVIRNLFLLFSLILIGKSNQIRFFEAIENVKFKNKRITEQPKVTKNVTSKIECAFECKISPFCLSFTFNDDSRVCDMFDQDFVHVTETQTTDETAWNYYYVVPAGNVIDKSQCELRAVGICHSFCFFYRNGFWNDTVQDLIQACSVEGGEVIKVDRYLKQYCMEKAVDAVIGIDNMAINGQQSNTTGEWTYFNGSEMTYFYWDYQCYLPEPDYISPEETPGEYQGIIAIDKACNFVWFDYSDWATEAVLCEIV